MDTERIDALNDATAYDSDGEKLGKVKGVFVDDSTQQPRFVEVGHAVFGRNSSLVPLRGHELEDEKLTLAFSKDLIKDAPVLGDHAHLSSAEEVQVYRHYGMDEADDIKVHDPAAADMPERRPADPRETAMLGTGSGLTGTGPGMAGDTPGTATAQGDADGVRLSRHVPGKAEEVDDSDFPTESGV